jgi:hypothetical protein
VADHPSTLRVLHLDTISRWTRPLGRFQGLRHDALQAHEHRGGLVVGVGVGVGVERNANVRVAFGHSVTVGRHFHRARNGGRTFRACKGLGF